MAYQVYNYEGTPFLIWSDEDLPVEYTTIPPKSGMYYPVKFHPDTQEWEELGTAPTPPPIDIPEENNGNDVERTMAILLYNDVIKTHKIKQLEDKVSLLMPLIKDNDKEE